jgi:hypothetical protein
MARFDKKTTTLLSPSCAFVSDGPGGIPATNGSIHRLLVLAVLAAGFIVRFLQARSYFLNPDEALHYLLASRGSLWLTYQATLTTAHPPLLILLLHYWRWLGQSELMLRLPSVVAGTATCGLTYLWLKKIADRSTAFIGLLLITLAPALIELLAEVRQYALLMFFMAACLYFSERAVQENSLLHIGMFSISLYAALVTHYSSLLFAFSMGVYMLVRMRPWSKRPGLFAAWLGGQVLALMLIMYLLTTHVARLKQAGVPKEIAETWLRKSIYHSGENHLLAFPVTQTLRVFTYLFSHGLFGTLALLAFLAGVTGLLWTKSQPQGRPAGRSLALLLALPFAVNCVAAIAGLYPYGRTRHCAFLAFFALAGASIGLSAWRPGRAWKRTLVVGLCLAVCNLFPSPPPLIRASDHKVGLMHEAVAYLRQSAPQGSTVFADYQSALLLGYYVCGHAVVQELPPARPLATDCGGYTLITAPLQKWRPDPGEFPQQLALAAEAGGIASGAHVWLFNAGWIGDSSPVVNQELARFGCPSPRQFGENILVCELTLDGDSGHAAQVPEKWKAPAHAGAE